MTDKEFKRLSRAQLIDIIYQLQLQIDKLNEEKQLLENELNDKRLRMNNVGNIAEAALEINNCFLSAQKAAEQYLNEIKLLHDETVAEYQKTSEKMPTEVKSNYADEKKMKLDNDGADKKITRCSDDSALEEILMDFKRKYLDNV